MQTRNIWQNGKFVPWDQANIHILSHTVHYGGGAFEGVRFYKSEQGPAIFRLNEHVDRLFYSANALQIKIPYSRNEVIEIVKEVVRESQLEAGYIRPIAIYGAGKLSVNPTGNPVEFAVACWSWGAYLPHESVDVKTSGYMRIHPDTTLVDAKICGHYVNSILAVLELKNTHYHEVLFLDHNKNVSEGSGENFFMVKEGVIYTPNLGSILKGITRDTVINLAKKLGFRVIESDISLSEAYAATEAFFTGTAAEVTPIRSIDDKILGDGQVGVISSALKQAYMDVVHGRNLDFVNYLTYVK